MARISRRRLLAALPLLPMVSPLSQTLAARPRRGARHLYIGTYTHPMGAPANHGQGIYSAEWDPATGRIGEPVLAARSPNPSFLALSPDRGALYAVNENEGDPQPDGGRGGSVSAFARDARQGALTPVGTRPSGGSDPCQLTVDRGNRALFVANYTDGTLSSFRVTGSGIEGPASRFQSEFTRYGLGPNRERQQSPHIHCASLSPDERFLLVSDLGTDHIWIFRADVATARLALHGRPWQSRPGAGPRHTRFHPNGRWVYSINEMAASVDALRWDASAGSLSRIAEASLRGADSPPDSTGAELQIDGEGRYLYASHRTENTLLVFAIHPDDGSLRPVQRIPSGGRNPRFFTLDPGGRWLLSANQDSGNIAVFARDPATGRLSDGGQSLRLGAPVCIVFA